MVCASDATSLNFAEAAMALATSTAQRRSQPFGPGAKCEQPIPWYIIDPTGCVIKDARIREAHKEKKLNGSLKWTTRLGLYSPTLYPGWDAITGIALAFTGACGSVYCDSSSLCVRRAPHALLGVDQPAPRVSFCAALMTPFEVGFLPPAPSPAHPLFIINRLVDIVFVLDMIFAFCTMTQLSMDKVTAAMSQSQTQIAGSTERGSESGKGAPVVWETNIRLLANDYLLSWFVIDVISIAPSVFDFLPSAFDEDAYTNNGYRVLRTIRALRLIKVRAHQ